MEEPNQSNNALCDHCIAKPVCFARRSMESDNRQYSHKIYKAKDYLIHAGDPFVGIYALRSGAAKSTMTLEGGHEQIIHFHFPGDLIGSDGFDSDHHINDVQFLDTSSVCFFKLAQVKSLMGESETIRMRLLKNMSHEIVKDQENLLSLSQLNSSQRLAKFLLDLSERYDERGLSPYHFELAMSRTDMANHLGLAIETVSRLLKRFQRDQVIQDRKSTRLNSSLHSFPTRRSSDLTDGF